MSILNEIAQRIRRHRLERQMSIRELAELSGLSQRYLVSAEQGKANLSVQKLSNVCQALGISLYVLFVDERLERIVAWLESQDQNQLSHIYDRLTDIARHDARTGKVALLGVRGAGKSTVGQLLAKHTKMQFVELDAEIERRADLTLSEIFAWHGEAYYRRLERDCLMSVLDTNRRTVIATGGGIVNDSDTFRLLTQNTYSVWLSAKAETHWSRVLDQGDHRPMRDHPHAMRELKSLVVEREPLYRQADVCITTDQLSPIQVALRIVDKLGVSDASSGFAR